jgi:hypothetical protein
MLCRAMTASATYSESGTLAKECARIRLHGEALALVWLYSSFFLLELVTGNEAQNRVFAVAGQTKGTADAKLNMVF